MALRERVVRAFETWGQLDYGQLVGVIQYGGEREVLDCMLRGLERGGVIRRRFDASWELACGKKKWSGRRLSASRADLRNGDQHVSILGIRSVGRFM